MYSKLSRHQTNKESAQFEQDDQAKDYKPWQRARLTSGEEVWVIRQHGDGQKTWYEVYNHDSVLPDEIQEWL